MVEVIFLGISRGTAAAIDKQKLWEDCRWSMQREEISYLLGKDGYIPGKIVNDHCIYIKLFTLRCYAQLYTQSEQLYT